MIQMGWMYPIITVLMGIASVFIVVVICYGAQ